MVSVASRHLQSSTQTTQESVSTSGHVPNLVLLVLAKNGRQPPRLRLSSRTETNPIPATPHDRRRTDLHPARDLARRFLYLCPLNVGRERGDDAKERECLEVVGRDDRHVLAARPDRGQVLKLAVRRHRWTHAHRRVSMGRRQNARQNGRRRRKDEGDVRSQTRPTYLHSSVASSFITSVTRSGPQTKWMYEGGEGSTKGEAGSWEGAIRHRGVRYLSQERPKEISAIFDQSDLRLQRESSDVLETLMSHPKKKSVCRVSQKGKGNLPLTPSLRRCRC